MVNRKRNVQLKVYVSEREKELIEQKYKMSNEKTFTEYAIKALLYRNIYKVNDEDLKTLYTEINRVGTNINQIAKRVNETGNIYKNDLEEIKSKLNSIDNFIDKYYSILKKIKEIS